MAEHHSTLFCGGGGGGGGWSCVARTINLEVNGKGNPTRALNIMSPPPLSNNAIHTSVGQQSTRALSRGSCPLSWCCLHRDCVTLTFAPTSSDRADRIRQQGLTQMLGKDCRLRQSRGTDIVFPPTEACANSHIACSECALKSAIRL